MTKQRRVVEGDFQYGGGRNYSNLPLCTDSIADSTSNMFITTSGTDIFIGFVDQGAGLHL